MLFPSRLFSACATLLLLTSGALAASDPAFTAPAGFEVTQYAGDDLAHDIFSMTIDSRGRVVVAGKGYVKVLHDTNGDGIADKATLFADLPKTGAHGMYFDGDDLICSGDSAVMRLRDTDGDGKTDGEPETLSTNRKPSEHGCNGIVKGPDGWYYNICGNDAGITAAHANLPGSPVAGPTQGTLVRIAPDGRGSQVVAHGFRNPYDFDFYPTGQILTVDSDGERDHHLPWYAGNRLFDIAVGAHHGWVLNGWQRAWSRPGYFFDNVERCVEIGRGSPTGVVTYRHRQFPERYRQGVFSVCWTFGTIYFLPLTPRGSTFDAKIEKFVQTTGNVGFAPVDIAVGPDGDMFVAIGGRGTQGGVFRIHYTGTKVEPIGGDDLHQVLAADQPLSSWSRAQWTPLAKKLGASPFEAAAADEKLPALDRIRAVEVLVEVFTGVSNELATRLSQSPEPLVVARTAWALTRRPIDRDAQQLLADLTKHADPVVQRAAWESIISLPELQATLDRRPDWHRGMSSPDRRVRAAAVTAARTAGRGSFMSIEDPTLADGNVRLDLANLWFEGTDPNNEEWTHIYFHVCTNAYNTARDADSRLEAVRLMQVGLGDILTSGGDDETETGYTAAGLDKIDAAMGDDLARVVAPAFPSGKREMDLELARLLGMLHADRPHLLENLASMWTDKSPPDDDLHYLLCAAQLPGVRGSDTTRATAHALASLHAKMDQRQWLPARSWPARVAEAFTKITRVDAHLPETLVEDPAFGRVEHTLFAAQMTGPTRLAATRKLMQTASASKDADAWSADLVELIGSTLPPEEALPALRPKIADARLRDAVALVLAAHADAADRAPLIASLDSSNAGVVEKSAAALMKMTHGSPAEMVIAIKSLGRHEVSRPAALALDALLRHWSGQTVAVTVTKIEVKAFKPWLDWFTAAHPEEAAGLAAFGGVDAATWRKRLAAVNWSAGDPQRGTLIYQTRLCAACHEGQRKIGPELKGIASRFSRDDLFANIVDPNLSISPTYRALQITMKDGTTHIGVPVYESPDSTILETAPGVTVRLTGDQVAATEPARRSPMPEGLLLGLTDADLADFYAYLQTLK